MLSTLKKLQSNVKVVLISSVLFFSLYGCTNPEPVEIGKKPLSSESGDPSGQPGDTMLTFRGYGNASGDGSSTSITLMFLLDTTSDMPRSPVNYIGAISHSLTSIVENLTQLGFTEVKIGYTAYTDSVNTPYAPTDQYKVLYESLGWVPFSDGGDWLDAGLSAIKDTVDYLKSSSTTDYNVMILITNDYSHDSLGNYPADGDRCSDRPCCQLTDTVNKINSIDASAKNNYKFFYIVPTVNTPGCTGNTTSNYTSPQAQMNDLLQKTLGSQGGGWLCWSDAGDIGGCLSYTLVDEIGRTTGMSATPEQKLVCLIDGAQFNILGNNVIYKTSFEKQYQLYKEEHDSSIKITSQPIINAVKSGDLEDGSATVTQFCFTEADAEAGNFGNVVTSREQTVAYSLEYIK